MEIDLEKCAGHTPGPWEWVAHPNGDVYIATPDRGRLIVMDAARMGMQKATVRFSQWTGIRDGVPRDRQGGIMTKGIFVSGRLHPDARLMIDAPKLLAEVVRLRADLAEAVQTLEAIEIAARMRFSPADILDENSPIREGMRAVLAKHGGGK